MSRNEGNVPPVPENDGDRSWMDNPDYQDFLDEREVREQKRVEKIDRLLVLAASAGAFICLIMAAQAGFAGRPSAIVGNLILFLAFVGAALVFSGAAEHLVRDAATADQELADEAANKAGRAPSWHPDNL